MDKKDIRKYQLAQLELLYETDKICKDLGIVYYLIAGTLLGAVRHGGFIPWDADIDIAMRRKDYELFRKYWEDKEESPYFYEHYSTEPNHWGPHAILRKKDTHIIYKTRGKGKYKTKYDGIYLDIFPLDEAPVDLDKQAKQAKKIKRIYCINRYKLANVYEDNISPIKLFAKKVVQFILSPFSFKFLNSKMDKIMQEYNGNGSNLLVSMASHYAYSKQCMNEDIYGEPKQMLFEGEMRYVPAKTQEYLKSLYGDYMKLPPEDKRYGELDSIERIIYGGRIDG